MIPYRIIKPLVTVVLAAYFKEIHFSHAERLPKDKPIILAVNHPTAFIDPCVIACWLKQPLHFLARGDFYIKSKFLRKVYHAFNIVPIFRLEDGGYEMLKTNYDSFKACYEVLGQNKIVMILAEGRTEHEKRLRDIKKGTARLAIGAVESLGNWDLCVVPVGVNYTDSDRFRSQCMIDFGEPLQMEDYRLAFEENTNKGIRLLTKDLKNSLLDRVIHIADPKDDEWVNNLLERHRNDLKPTIFSISNRRDDLLRQEKQLADYANQLPEPEKASLKAKTQSYFDKLKDLKISDLGMAKRSWFNPINTLLIIIGFIPCLLGTTVNFLPAWLADFLSRRYIKSISFRASVAVAIGLVAYLIYWLTIMIIVIFNAKWWLILGVLWMPMAGKFVLTYSDFFRIWNAARKAASLDKAMFVKLEKERAALKLNELSAVMV